MKRTRRLLQHSIKSVLASNHKKGPRPNPPDRPKAQPRCQRDLDNDKHSENPRADGSDDDYIVTSMIKLCHIRTFWCCQMMFQELGFSLLVTRCMLQPTPKSQLSMLSLQMLCFPKEYFRHWTLLEAWWRLCWQRLDSLVFSCWDCFIQTTHHHHHSIILFNMHFYSLQNFNECYIFLQLFLCSTRFLFLQKCPLAPGPDRWSPVDIFGRRGRPGGRRRSRVPRRQGGGDAHGGAGDEGARDRAWWPSGGPVVAQWCPVVPVVARG